MVTDSGQEMDSESRGQHARVGMTAGAVAGEFVALYRT